MTSSKKYYQVPECFIVLHTQRSEVNNKFNLLLHKTSYKTITMNYVYVEIKHY